jgi:phytoene dehydrogenase-like protein
VPKLWHIGASTHPGPGLGAGSGTIVARELLKEPLVRRLAGRLPFVGGGR